MFPGWGKIEHVKLGKGVLGKTAPVAMTLLLLLMVAIYVVGSAHPWMILLLAALAIFTVAGFFGLAFWYANKYPGPAVLEGGELVRYNEIEMAAKDPKIIDAIATQPVNTAPPKALAGGGGQDA